MHGSFNWGVGTLESGRLELLNIIDNMLNGVENVSQPAERSKGGGGEHAASSETTSALGGAREVSNEAGCGGDLNESLNVEICGFLRMESGNGSPGIQFWPIA